MNAQYIIDGAKFSSEKNFYNYIEKLFTEGLNWKIGRNLNAFNDILSGGFGKHECDESITVIWKNMSKSRENLKTGFLKTAIRILEEHDRVEFQQYENQIPKEN